MRYVVIGDVHGCLEELRSLIRALDLLLGVEGTTLVFAGDLTDRGPDSAGVVKYVRELSTQRPVILTDSNHEEKHARWRAHEARRLATGKTNPMRDPVGRYASLLASLSEADIAFLDEARLFYRVPGHDAIVVHAGIAPSVTELPAEAPRLRDLTGKVKENLASMIRVRHVDPETGKMKSMDQTDPALHPHWTDLYDGRFGKVIYGHEPYTTTTPVEAKHALGIDLGCGFGGYLVGHVFFEDGTEKDVIVPALKAYAHRQTEAD